MTFLTILLTLFLPVIGSSPLPIPAATEPNFTPSPERSERFATRAEESGGGGGIGIGAIAGIIIAVLAIILIILFIFIHNRRRNSLSTLTSSATYISPPPAYTSPPTKIYYPSQQHYPTLPKYTGPNTSAAYVPSSGGVRFPSAIYPGSNRGYYTQRTEGGERGVRFGEVGVRGYH
ncbi:hypothetical protein V865_003084 [Kwoniella europaea PYCC6329]|uniref:Uncharacterized protein n=1 Tax=Kwoniella europaea PYCC6329 TaxID=1423913 RepID=A0AAX4KGX0_9TREE